jgi:dTDP-D-glucose 4,6-dehydratase
MIFSIAQNDKDLEVIIDQMKDKKPSGEIDYQCMDHEKVSKFFDWSPSINLSEGMKISFDWYKDYLAK